MQLGLSVALTQPGLGAAGASPPPPSILVPANWDFIAYGDSRTENALGASLGAAGYNANDGVLGPAGWLARISGQRLRLGRYPNFGISASRTDQGVTEPRQFNNGTVTQSTPATWFRGNDSANKSASVAGAHPAGIVVFLYGTNDQNNNANCLYNTTSRTNVQTMLNNIGASKLVVMLNESPTGVNTLGAAGASRGAATDDQRNFSIWLSGLDFQSGQPHSRSNVIVVDSWGLLLDTVASSAGNWKNKVGWLRDGLHFTPSASRAIAQAIHNRLGAVYGATYTGLPSQAALPTINPTGGVGTPLGASNYVNVNPLLRPGSGGQIFNPANFSSPPVATTIPQGWFMQASTSLGLAVSCDNTLTDSDGYPMTRVTVSGTLADQSSGNVQFGSSSLVTGALAVTDKVRAAGRIRLAAGSVGVSGVSLAALFGPAGTTAQVATSGGGSSGGTGDRLGYLMNEAGLDAADDAIIMTQLLDGQDPNMATANGGPGVISSPTGTVRITIGVQNFTGAPVNINAVVDVSRCGLFKNAT